MVEGGVLDQNSIDPPGVWAENHEGVDFLQVRATNTPARVRPDALGAEEDDCFRSLTDVDWMVAQRR
jgi:hypothetical protein